MRKLCLIRFSTKKDYDVSIIIASLAATPRCYGKEIDGAFITTFQTNYSIEECKAEFEKLPYKFMLIDITENNTYEEMFGNFSEKYYRQPIDKEKQLLEKVKQFGVKSLSQEEHDFLQSCFL